MNQKQQKSSEIVTGWGKVTGCDGLQGFNWLSYFSRSKPETPVTTRHSRHYPSLCECWPRELYDPQTAIEFAHDEYSKNNITRAQHDALLSYAQSDSLDSQARNNRGAA